MLLLSCEFSLPSGFPAVILTTACWSSREINVGESDCSWRTLGRALWVNCLRVGGLYAACYQTVNAWLLMPYLVFNLNYLHVLCQRYYEGYIEKSQLMWCPAVWNTKHVYIWRIWLIRQSDNQVKFKSAGELQPQLYIVSPGHLEFPEELKEDNWGLLVCYKTHCSGPFLKFSACYQFVEKFT